MYATAYDALNRNRQFQEIKRNTRVALRGVFHVACLLIMFYLGRLAMPYSRRENVRHATLFLSAPRVSTCWQIGVERKENLMRCRTLDEVVGEVLRFIDDEKSMHPEPDAEFFFRGECRNYKSDSDSDIFGTAFQSYLDRTELQEYERQLYEDALRFNVSSFEEDRTMVERVARMQHYGLPTRFCDVSTNALLSAHFACGGGERDITKRDNGCDGFIRVMKVARHKMKSFGSDTIQAIAHLPLVDAWKVRPSEFDGLGYLSYEIKNNRPGFYTERMEPEIGEQLRLDIQQVWAFRPMMNSRRISKQDGLFLAFGCGDDKRPLAPTFSPADYENESAPSYGIKQIGYVQIASDAKKRLREQLRLFGMPGELVYPELSNVCDELKIRFEVIKKGNEQ